MDDKKERKTNLLTIRMSREDKNTLDYLSDSIGKSTTDTVSRACKFFLNTNLEIKKDSDTERKEKKECVVHLRMSDSDMDGLAVRSKENSETISQVIRQAIKAYGSAAKRSY